MHRVDRPKTIFLPGFQVAQITDRGGEGGGRVGHCGLKGFIEIAFRINLVPNLIS